MADGANRPAYNSTWQIRNDAWCSLEETSGQLVLAGAQHRPFGAMDEAITKLLDVLGPIERFWAFPGTPAFQKLRRLFTAGKYDRFAALARGINRALATDSYRNGHAWDLGAEDDALDHAAHPLEHGRTDRPYFEVLVVEDMTEHQEHALREELRRWRRPDDPFIYEVVVVPSLEDAIMAARLNFRLQACVVRRRFARRSRYDSSSLAQFIDSIVADDVMEQSPDDRAQILARALARLRPELDLYLMTEIAVEDLAGRLSHHFRRIFHAREGSLELHLSILDGVAARYRTPFFNALKNYSHRPTGVFHALPISHGKSITESHWIHDMLDFYGMEIFLAETSATCGGLDSLLEPTGPLREAQQLAAKTFGSRQTYFVTNGTSTANKIVVQALVQPGDIVLVDRNCHQSHHYGLMLAGAMVTYLDAYPLNRYSMYGAVPIKEIKSQLLALRRAGKLNRVKMVLLTNCTFDGIVYDVARVMEECLAIKPDLVFLWDEAWFAFARFHPVYRPRTAMRAARTLAEKLRLPEYRAGYQKFLTEVGAIDAADDDVLLNRRLMPDPARARVRVYSTQSTHKTLTSLRQGSMIHQWDQDFSHKVEETFHEAYMTHTSTSPNYQILASLDLGRRQADLEGFEMVQKRSLWLTDAPTSRAGPVPAGAVLAGAVLAGAVPAGAVLAALAAWAGRHGLGLAGPVLRTNGRALRPARMLGPAGTPRPAGIRVLAQPPGPVRIVVPARLGAPVLRVVRQVPGPGRGDSSEQRLRFLLWYRPAAGTQGERADVAQQRDPGQHGHRERRAVLAILDEHLPGDERAHDGGQAGRRQDREYPVPQPQGPGHQQDRGSDQADAEQRVHGQRQRGGGDLGEDSRVRVGRRDLDVEVQDHAQAVLERQHDQGHRGYPAKPRPRRPL